MRGDDLLLRRQQLRPLQRVPGVPGTGSPVRRTAYSSASLVIASRIFWS
jgi:hypothetical protein